MTFSEVIQTLVLVFGPVGVFAGIWGIWKERKKPIVDMRTLELSVNKSEADIFKISLEGLVNIIEEYRTERDRDRLEFNEVKQKLQYQINELADRVRQAEENAVSFQVKEEIARDKIKAGIDHIVLLEGYITLEGF